MQDLPADENKKIDDDFSRDVLPCNVVFLIFPIHATFRISVNPKLREGTSEIRFEVLIQFWIDAYSE